MGYEYRLLTFGTVLSAFLVELTEAGAQGFHVVASGTDARDGTLAWVLMERESLKNSPRKEAKHGI